jgi:hypothetical protein
MRYLRDPRHVSAVRQREINERGREERGGIVVRADPPNTSVRRDRWLLSW